MSYYETAYPSLLSGVSEQQPQMRLPGQLTTQVNMLSDLVRGLVRRPPLEYQATFPTFSGSGVADERPYSSRYKWRLLSVGGRDVLFIANYGSLFMADAITGAHITTTLGPGVAAYLVGLYSSADHLIKTTTVGPNAYVVDTNQKPNTVNTSTGSIDPENAGYGYVVSGAFNTKYTITVQDYAPIGPNLTATGTYTTPDGSTAGDADMAAPEYIAQQLETSLLAAISAAGGDFPTTVTVDREGAYLFVRRTGTGGLQVNSDNPPTLVQVSNKSHVRSAGELPAVLPSVADTYSVQVGTGAAAVYYRYIAETSQWVEDAKYGQAEYLANMGLVIKPSGNDISVELLRSDRRAAGTAETNPTLKISEGITGISSFKGRLVLLAGQYVCMSAANNPLVWYRTTITGLDDSDPIEIAAAEISAPYHSAVPFNTGLLVTSNKHQAFIPGDIVLTPRTATIAIISEYDTTDTAALSSIGRSALLPFKRRAATDKGTQDYTGLLEALPTDSYTASLLATDITAHIPRYMEGLPRCIISSSSNDVVAMIVAPDKPITWGSPAQTSTGWETYSIYVHQFLWEGSEKTATAWHRWDFKQPVLFMYFIQDNMYVVFGLDDPTSQSTGYVSLGVIALGRGSEPAHYLDYGRKLVAGIEGTDLRINSGHEAGLYRADLDDLRAYKLTGDDAGLGEKPITTVVPISSSLIVQPIDASYGDEYIIGYLYKSEFEPTPPILRDRSGHVLADAKIPVIRYKAHVVDSGLLQAQVSDKVYKSGVFDVPIIGLDAPNTLGTAPLSTSGVVTIPARTSARDTSLVLSTSDYYGFTVSTLEYGFKLNMKHRRG